MLNWKRLKCLLLGHKPAITIISRDNGVEIICSRCKQNINIESELLKLPRED